MKLVDLQSLLQLGVGLNLAFYAFGEISKPRLNRVTSKARFYLDTAKKVEKNEFYHSISGSKWIGDWDAHLSSSADFEAFRESVQKLQIACNRLAIYSEDVYIEIVIYAGYACIIAALTDLAVLTISSFYAETLIGTWTGIVIFIGSYIFAFLLVIFNIYVLRTLSSIEAKIDLAHAQLMKHHTSYSLYTFFRDGHFSTEKDR